MALLTPVALSGCVVVESAIPVIRITGSVEVEHAGNHAHESVTWCNLLWSFSVNYQNRTIRYQEDALDFSDAVAVVHASVTIRDDFRLCGEGRTLISIGPDDSREVGFTAADVRIGTTMQPRNSDVVVDDHTLVAYGDSVTFDVSQSSEGHIVSGQIEFTHMGMWAPDQFVGFPKDEWMGY